MANFAVAASQKTIEKANQIMETYAQDGDKKEDTLLRILEIAESESVKGTHPELLPNLKAVDKTITVLIQQINGIVSGQDHKIEEINKYLEKALEEKAVAVETANKATQEADTKVKECSEALEKALEQLKQAQDAAKASQALADEKTATNEFLTKQLQDAKEETKAYKKLQADYAELKDSYKEQETNNKILEQKLQDAKESARSNLKEQIKTVKAEMNLEKEQAITAREKELEKQIRSLEIEKAKLEAKLESYTKQEEK